MTTKFTLTIRLGNDAMQTPDNIAETLNRVADALYGGAAGYEYDPTFNGSGAVRDVFGNKVGAWQIKGEQH